MTSDQLLSPFVEPSLALLNLEPWESEHPTSNGAPPFPSSALEVERSTHNPLRNEFRGGLKLGTGHYSLVTGHWGFKEKSSR